MKKLIIFESILILFFVLAWNVSKAKHHSVYVDEMCTEIANSMNDLMIGIISDHKDTSSILALIDFDEDDPSFMVMLERRLMGLKKLYNEFCDPKYFKSKEPPKFEDLSQ